MENSIKIGSHYYNLNNEHFSLKWEESLSYLNELSYLKQFPDLISASFSSSNFNDEGLIHLSNCSEIESLNLQETEITNEGIKYLKKLKKLKHLRLKENPQLTNECISNLTELESLQDLQIQETSITEDGLGKLIVLKNLEYITIDVWENNYTFEGLLKISIRIPNCNILAKGDGIFCNGEFEGKWRH